MLSAGSGSVHPDPRGLVFGSHLPEPAIPAGSSDRLSAGSCWGHLLKPMAGA